MANSNNNNNNTLDWESPDYFRLFYEGGTLKYNNKNLNISYNATDGVYIGNESFDSSSLIYNQLSQNASVQVGGGSDNVDGAGGNGLRNYEPGSNFMLLLEDFGEFFYNYNNLTQSASNATVDEYGTYSNCSVGNSTCGNVVESKY